LYGLSLRLLRLAFWLGRDGETADARLALRLSQWAWRAAAGRPHRAVRGTS